MGATCVGLLLVLLVVVDAAAASSGVDVVSMSTPAGVNYAHYDNVGSVTNTTNASGVTQWARSFEPFGPKRSETNVSGSAPATPLQYTGEHQDPTTSLLNLRARQYDPANGRFLSPDPLEAPFTSPYGSGYAYVGGNPLMYVDPSGLTRQGVWAPFWDGVRLFGSGALSPLTDAASCLNGFFRWQLETQACAFTAINVATALTGTFTARLFIEAGIRGAAAAGAGLVGRRLLLEETGAITLGGRTAAKAETEVVQRAMSQAELDATLETGLVRGGRSGTHYVSDAVNANAKRARQRLSLPQTPEVRVDLEVPKGAFGPPTRVEPNYRMPGGGSERTATGPVRCRVVGTRRYC